MVCGIHPLTRSALDTLLAAVCGEDDGNAAHGKKEGGREGWEKGEGETDT